jgi:hypothetical protein
MSLYEDADCLALQLEVNANAHQEAPGTERRRAAAMIRDLLNEMDVRRTVESDYDIIERQLQGKPCGRDVPGTVPSWAGEDQVSPCPCVLDPKHSGAHECAHEGQRH